MRQELSNVMFDFITNAVNAKQESQILHALENTSKQFGMERFAISGIPLAYERIDPYFMLNGWPGEWFERYVAENYVHVDPVIYRTKTSDDAFVWSEVIDSKKLSFRARRVMNEATEFGMMDGFSVPLHTADGLQAIVTYATRKVDLSPEARGALHIISIYAHNRLRALLSEKAGAIPRVPVEITVRERECIAWCSAGKTDWEIGQIINRSERTVHHVISNAQRKMNVVNRAQLIAEAFRLGILR
jgi:LuxR family transcriptional regulator, quorum-sensing system regulator BjaR1